MDKPNRWVTGTDQRYGSTILNVVQVDDIRIFPSQYSEQVTSGLRAPSLTLLPEIGEAEALNIWRRLSIRALPV
jgi:hypothetical protein